MRQQGCACPVTTWPPSLPQSPPSPLQSATLCPTRTGAARSCASSRAPLQTSGEDAAPLESSMTRRPPTAEIGEKNWRDGTAAGVEGAAAGDVE